MTLDWLTYFPSPARGVWHLGPVPIRAYAMCIIVGIIAALLIGDRRWRARGGEPGVIYDIALWAVPFGLIGGRLYHLATDWRTYFGEGGVGWQATPRIWDGGLGIWGAVALGGVGAWIGCRRRGIPLPAFGDAVAPGVILAQAIGRIGNYFNQELYGRETTLPWGMQIFWREDSAGLRDPHLLDGVSTGELYKIVQPTFLYELLWNLLVFGLLIYADRRFTLGHGRLFALYVAGYCIGRFGIELLRDDTATHIAGIRVNSFTSTFVFIGAVVYILLAPKGREDPEALRRTWQHAEADAELPVPESADEHEKELVAVGAVSGGGGDADEPDPVDASEAEDTEPETDSEPDSEPEAAADGADDDGADDDGAEDADADDEVADDESAEPETDLVESEPVAEAEEPDAEPESDVVEESEAADTVDTEDVEPEHVEPEDADTEDVDTEDVDGEDVEAVDEDEAAEHEAAEDESVEPETDVTEEPEDAEDPEDAAEPEQAADDDAADGEAAERDAAAEETDAG